jgi:hypothetical protein
MTSARWRISSMFILPMVQAGLWRTKPWMSERRMSGM